MELEVAAKYPSFQEYDHDDLGSYLRWQYGIYHSMGMSYDEFWNNTDYLLVESYIKSYNMKVDAETASNWELSLLIREAMIEVAGAIHVKEESKRHKFPKKPTPRSIYGAREQERIDNINKDLKFLYENMLRERKTEK